MCDSGGPIVRVWLAAGALLWAVALSAAEEMPMLTLLSDSVVDPRALNLPQGRYGTCINGQTFQIEAVTTFAGWQYATYFNADGHPCVARRELPAGPWQRIVFTDYRIDHDDVHNVSVVGICPADGTIHLAYDHHVHPLHYRVSKPGAATDPGQIRWDADLFGPHTDPLTPHAPTVTYPAFFPTPDGKLQFYYRVDFSGNGDSHLAAYDPRQGGWTHLGMFISRHGVYEGSTKRSAYHNGFTYDASGRLHTTWVWREPGDLTYTHDLMYAWSDDQGRTWRNNAGEIIGQAGGQPMHLDSPGVRVYPIAYKWGLMNQLTQTVDSRGRVHVLLWHNPPEAQAMSNDLNDWRYFHYWRDEQGRWQRNPLPFFGRKPSIVTDDAGNLYVVFTKPDNLRYHGHDPGGPLHITRASATTGWTDWQTVYQSTDLFVGEPRIDRPRWESQRILSIYAQQRPAQAGAPSDLRVIDLKAAEPH